MFWLFGQVEFHAGLGYYVIKFLDSCPFGLPALGFGMVDWMAVCALFFADVGLLDRRL